MKITFVGTADAFGTGGRAHTCIRIDGGGSAMMIDFGAGSMVGWRRLGFSFNDIDAIYITHLHGDHFGGLPFLLLESQFVEPRTKPLTIMGPPGLKTRLKSAMEAFFPNSSALEWRFPLDIVELQPGGEANLAGFAIRTIEVQHASGGPPTAVRVARDGKTFAFSGDTSWTDALIDISAGADLFACECHSLKPGVPGHMNWQQLKENLPRLSPRRMLLTHMSVDMLDNAPRICAEAGLGAAEDGLVVEI